MLFWSKNLKLIYRFEKKVLIVSSMTLAEEEQNSILNFSKILSSSGFELHIILKQGGSLKEEFENRNIIYGTKLIFGTLIF